MQETPINTPTPEEPDPLFQRGFNDGYLISKHQPALATKQADSPYYNGMLAGKKEYDDEINRWLRTVTRDHQPNRENERDRNLDRDRGLDRDL